MHPYPSDEASLPLPPSPQHAWRRVAWFAVIWGTLVVNLAVFILRFAVDVPNADQWVFHDLVCRDHSWWSLVDYQHGPHRQGVLFPLTAQMLEWCHGDSRVESLWIACWLVLAAMLAFTLPRHLSGHWHWADVLPLMWSLSLLQYETITTTPNLSHSVGPLALVLLVAHALLLRNLWWRWSVVAALGVALTFTGFGLFAAAVLGVITLWLIVRPSPGERRIPAAVAGVLLAGGWVLFLRDYVFNPASAGFRFPHQPIGGYAPFVLRMLAYTQGFPEAGCGMEFVGALLLCSALTGTAVALWRLLRHSGTDTRPVVVLLLLGTALAFAANTAVGRIHLGLSAGMTSRYVSLLVPLPTAVYLLLRNSSNRWLRRPGLLALTFLALWPYRDITREPRPALGTWGLPRNDLIEARNVRNRKLSWIWAYRETGNVDSANNLVHVASFRREDPAKLEVIIQHLTERGWGPFRPHAHLADSLPFLAPETVIFAGFHDEESDGMRWMPECAQLVVANDSAWLNVSLRDRFAGLPADAALLLDFAGHKAKLRSFGAGEGIALPLAGQLPHVIRFSSPAGTGQPQELKLGAGDSRSLSFRFGPVFIDAVPDFPELTKAGDGRWIQARIITQ